MHSYPRHLGDYAKDTGHLSALEHGCYTLLTDWYYASEKPIPAGKVYRICKASSKQERAAVDAVLSEFFKKDGAEWRHKRIDAEIAKCQESTSDNEDRKENERERQRRHRERRKALFEALRELDEVPPYDTSTPDLEALLSRVTKRDCTRDESVSVTPDATANQEPIANNQLPVIKNPWPDLSSLNGIDFSKWPSLPTLETMRQWLKVRKTKRATNSQIAMDDVCEQMLLAEQQGVSAEDCIRYAVKKSWSGFKIEWIANEQFREGEQRLEIVSKLSARRPILEKLTDRSWSEA